MKNKHYILKLSNILFLLTAIGVIVLLATYLSPIINQMQMLWAKCLYWCITTLGVDASLDRVFITVPSVTDEYPFGFANPHTRILFYLEVLSGLVLISFFLVKSTLLKWSMLILSIPISTLVAVASVGLTVFFGITCSDRVGLFLYFRALGFITHLFLVIVLGGFAYIMWRKRKCEQGNREVREKADEIE